MNVIRKFIIVDDDPVNNAITRITIKRALGTVDTKIFPVPEEGLAFIQTEYIKIVAPTILFLDINMPTITGWEFLEQYEKFTEEVKNQITIYILSSSVDQRDKDKAESNQYIKGFISKPVQPETILAISNGKKK
jgi:CheY-like chemotaxis protein